MSFAAAIASENLLMPLIIAAPFIYLAGLAIGRWLNKRHNVGLGIFYHWFVFALAAYVPAKAWSYSRFGPEPASPHGEPWHFFGIRCFGTLVAILGILTVLALVRRFFWGLYFEQRHGAAAPKLLQQVFGFGVFCTAVLVILSKRHGIVLDAFLAGSGIIAIVVGFAMQETLANIVSGIALQIGKPFKTGDWLIVTDHRAEVIEVNWRSTRLRTNDDVYLDIPNKTIVSTTITNLSFPTKTHSNRIRVGFDYDAPPNLVRELLIRATEAVPLILRMPPVKVFLKNFGDSALVYEIKYSLDDEARFNDIEDAIRTNIWYEAKRAGIRIPFPQRVVQLTREGKVAPRNAGAVKALIDRIDLLSPLSESQREQMLEQAHVLQFGRGERIIKQGNEGCSMFVILSGELDVFIEKDGRETHVALLHAGEAFGEMCLLTGEARTATVRAKTDSLVWEIRRAEMQPLLQENAELAARLSELLARRKMQTEDILASQTPAPAVKAKTEEYARGVLGKIRSLFEI